MSESDPTRAAHAPTALPSRTAFHETEREALLDELSDVMLPLMWTLRQAAMRALEPLGIRPGKALVLGLIASGVGSPSALADLLETTPPTLSSLLGDLEERGLVARRVHPDDRRRVLVEATADGHAMTERIRVAWNAAAAERSTAVSDEDLRHLVRIYRALTGSS